MNQSISQLKHDEYASNFSVFSFSNAVPCLGDYEMYFKQFCSMDDKIMLNILSNLEFPEVLSLKATCKSLNKKIGKKLIKNYVRAGCITDSVRKNFWMNNIDYKTMEDLIKREIEINDNSNTSNVKYNSGLGIYKVILQKSDEEKEKVDRKFCKVYEEIQRDLNRTFHIGKFATEEGQFEIGRVLTALAYIRPEIGYCQGMNFVAGALLNFIDEEDLVFWIFLSLLDLVELNSLYFRVIFIFNIEHA